MKKKQKVSGTERSVVNAVAVVLQLAAGAMAINHLNLVTCLGKTPPV